MFESNPPKTEELDRAGKLILMAAAASESEIEAAASSPFLFTRVRAGINEERRRRDPADVSAQCRYYPTPGFRV